MNGFLLRSLFNCCKNLDMLVSQNRNIVLMAKLRIHLQVRRYRKSKKDGFFIFFLLEDQQLNIEDLTDVHVLIRSADGDLIATPISVGKAFTSE